MNEFNSQIADVAVRPGKRLEEWGPAALVVEQEQEHSRDYFCFVAPLLKCIAKGRCKRLSLMTQRATDFLRVKDADLVKLLQNARNLHGPRSLVSIVSATVFSPLRRRDYDKSDHHGANIHERRFAQSS